MVRRLIVGAGFFGLFLGASVVAAAQSLEVEGGIAYAIGRGETPGPQVATADFGVTAWINERWGVAGTATFGLGEMGIEPPARPFPASGATRLVAKTNLRLVRFLVRRRYLLEQVDSIHVDLGFGLLVYGAFDDEILISTSSGIEEGAQDRGWKGVSLELLVGNHFTDNFAVKGGIAVDFGLETTYVRAVVLTAFAF